MPIEQNKPLLLHGHIEGNLHQGRLVRTGELLVDMVNCLVDVLTRSCNNGADIRHNAVHSSNMVCIIH